MNAKLTALGQTGYLLEYASTRILIDPYLSDSVAEHFGEDLRRQVGAPFLPANAPMIDHLLLTHAHLDHTDPATIAPLLASQPHITVMGPYEVRELLSGIGISQVHQPPLEWRVLGPGLEVRAVPAAHTEILRNPAGEFRDIGYLLRIGTKVLYHAGDTIPHEEIFSSLLKDRVDIALLPVNERNYYRDAKGIIGNMTIREAFQMASELGTSKLIPTHWDMFAPNSVYPEEIELLHRLIAPPFELKILRTGEILEI
jgi:L-ascorbate metabolism protein UlaG (beta-lactamase superfamily)